MKLLLIGGGSGGHIYPLFSVADYTIKNNILSNEDIHFIVADNKNDAEYFKNTTYTYTPFSVAKWRRYWSLENIKDFFIFFYNIVRSFAFLIKNKPEKIFSKGGFVSLPFGISAYILRIPFILHETDASMGLSNRIVARMAKKILTGFPSQNPNHIWVGNPVREQFFDIPPKKENLLPKVFIFGGSQGAQAINEWIRWFFETNTPKATALLVTGKGKSISHPPYGITEVEFLHEDFCMHLHEADIVIARAGGSIAELAAAQKCSILIPLPSAANDHQRKNAAYAHDYNAAICIKQDMLYTSTTTALVLDIIENKQQQQYYAHNIATLAKKNATEMIVKNIFPNKEII